MAEPIPMPRRMPMGLVPMLTELLARAQRGEISQIAYAYLEPGPDGDYGVGASANDDGGCLRLIGAVADLQHTLITSNNTAQD